MAYDCIGVCVVDEGSAVLALDVHPCGEQNLTFATGDFKGAVKYWTKAAGSSNDNNNISKDNQDTCR